MNATIDYTVTDRQAPSKQLQRELELKIPATASEQSAIYLEQAGLLLGVMSEIQVECEVIELAVSEYDRIKLTIAGARCAVESASDEFTCRADVWNRSAARGLVSAR